jgi:hypothetical protein
MCAWRHAVSSAAAGTLCLGAARRWTFVPGTKDGAPVAVVVRVQVTLKLES